MILNYSVTIYLVIADILYNESQIIDIPESKSKKKTVNFIDDIIKKCIYSVNIRVIEWISLKNLYMWFHSVNVEQNSRPMKCNE